MQTIKIRNLTSKISNEHLEEIFSLFGEVRDATVKNYKGSVTFYMCNDAENAQKYMDGATLDGRRIRCDL